MKFLLKNDTLYFTSAAILMETQCETRFTILTTDFFFQLQNIGQIISTVMRDKSSNQRQIIIFS